MLTGPGSRKEKEDLGDAGLSTLLKRSFLMCSLNPRLLGKTIMGKKLSSFIKHSSYFGYYILNLCSF